jgi:hypothetical protein
MGQIGTMSFPRDVCAKRGGLLFHHPKKERLHMSWVHVFHVFYQANVLFFLFLLSFGTQTWQLTLHENPL